jgi:hypothetical protein
MPLRSERRYIGLGDVKSGMMIEFNYAKKAGGSGRYVVLVVDPDKKNDRATEPQLHGFVIGDLTDSQLIEFFSSFGTTVKIDYEDRRASVVENLDSQEAYNKFASSKYVRNRSYRTFNLSGITRVRQVLVGSVD